MNLWKLKGLISFLTAGSLGYYLLFDRGEINKLSALLVIFLITQEIITLLIKMGNLNKHS